MTTPCRLVALVDDDADLRTATAQLLSLDGFEVTPFADGRAALAAIGADFAGIVVTDVRMPRLSGIDLLAALRDRDADLPVILMTGHGDVAMAVQALQSGAWDFLTKPFDPSALIAAANRAATARALVLENRRLRDAGAAAQDDLLAGEAPAIARLRALIPIVAETALDLVIEGETGTGKELLARAIHRAGRRARHRFLTIDCATVPPALADGALFARNGPIAGADRGTLFLDNLHLAPPELWRQLSRLAEQRAVALDQRDPDPVDLRIVAAIDAGAGATLPADLYHRLAGMTLRMPALAERREDIPLLLARFAAEAAERHRRPLPPLADIAHRFAARDWPGNVRELRMAAERLVLGLEETSAAADDRATLPDRLRAFERAAILEAIRKADGDVATAIATLGIPRETFYYRVKRLGIDLRHARSGGR